MVAYLFCVIAGLSLRPRSRVPWRLLTLLAIGLLAMWVTRFHVDLPGGKGRDISAEQVVANIYSVAGGDTGSESLDSTKEWRMDWWNEIIRYTIHGPYRWTGKGFGINLADDDGFRLDEDGTLRSPHSVHMTFLARAGLPGLALWIFTLAMWLIGVVDRYLRARRQGDLRWQGVFLFIGCYWCAFLINASFDVFLEGPMGGIWFWCLFGFGLGAMWVFDRHPEALSQAWGDSAA
jgi:O-antigen ligase